MKSLVSIILSNKTLKSVKRNIIQRQEEKSNFITLLCSSRKSLYPLEGVTLDSGSQNAMLLKESVKIKPN